MILRGPFEILINGEALHDVEDIVYEGGVLNVVFFPTDFDKANQLVAGKEITTIEVVPCDSDKAKALGRVLYTVNGYVPSIYAAQKRVMVVSLLFKDVKAKFVTDEKAAE